MSNDSRIPTLTITQTVPRQTPHNDFGTLLARAANEVVRSGAGLVGGMIPAGPIVSAAISSTKTVVSAVAPKAHAGGMPAAADTGGTSGAGAGNQEAWDLYEAQKMLAAEGQKFNMAYLSLQNEMQKESREHNAVSNIMKVRHDSAKAAINNIR
ncbi:hypothetical protein A176_001262 [Myxococcus hansupus]|uniref:Uncharacterized protein n=1 Tax=Pseudomyxococcus hansupus TaxID=1297742 RepID=A0A0H4WSL6_9BACT|nr:hypothetical protein [Myxococcus hansupus]AKQ64350.1 hypothetical protein A176_001262 [Myxococcus hansupus]